ncbi:UNVERIFIED_CONTAM: hypothetical protein Slati_3088900 [Sesamum latifolium]|uniref:Uncharacterized protein n=1 Tax=Sesamum latifolium TaxID=2727402 RepID=A0AAW2UWN1_9LAMI
MIGTDPLLGTYRPRYTLRLHWIRLIMTTSGYSHLSHKPKIQPLCAHDCRDSSSRGLLPYYRSRGFKSYRPSLQGFHMTIPASQFNRADT